MVRPGTWISTSTSNGCGSRTCSTPTARRMTMRGRVRIAGFALLAAVASACATGGVRPASSGSGGGDAVARLEAERAAKPNNAGVLRALGIVYYKAGRFADASRVLEQARAMNPKDGTTALYAGLSAEGM